MKNSQEIPATSLKQKQIFIVDDDERLERLLQRLLKKELFATQSFQTGQALLQKMQKDRPDLIILDVNLPDINGMDLIGKIRGISSCGIILLTGRQETIDRVLGLELGADDYVCKPFDQRELIARIKSVLRRLDDHQPTSETQDPHETFTFGQWRLDVDAQELSQENGEKIPLTHYEFTVLHYFLRHPNRVITREQILHLLSGRSFESFDRSVDVLIGKIRKKIENDPKNPAFVHTVRGSGYKFTK
jgi:two-component system OmpR family response regulator